MATKRIYKRNRLVIILAVILVIIGGAFFLLKNDTNKNITSVQQSPSAVLNTLNNSLTTKGTIEKGTYYRAEDWKDPKDSTANILSGNLLSIQSHNDLDQSNTLDKSIMDNLQSQGFTSGYVDDQSNEYRVWRMKTFRKDGTVCLVEINSTEPSNVFCGQPDGNYNTLIQELTPIIKANNDPAGAFSIIKESQGFVLGRSSTHWVAQKTEEGWIKLYDAIEPPMCADVEQYNIPEEIDNCYINESELKYN